MLLTVYPYARKVHSITIQAAIHLTTRRRPRARAANCWAWRSGTDLAITEGHHNIKIGVDLKQTRIIESFNFGITDPAFNAMCDAIWWKSGNNARYRRIPMIASR